MIKKIQKFFLEVTVELKKVSWTPKNELMDATWIVIVSSICLGIYIGLTDVVLAKFLGLIIR